MEASTSTELSGTFRPKIAIKRKVGHFTVKTATTPEEILAALHLRYAVFQYETVGGNRADGIDTDEYDLLADHLVIVDENTKRLVTTCRLNCSRFTKRFYSEQNFFKMHSSAGRR